MPSAPACFRFFPRFEKIPQDSTGVQRERGSGSEVQPCKLMLLGMLVGYRAAAGSQYPKNTTPAQQLNPPQQPQPQERQHAPLPLPRPTQLPR